MNHFIGILALLILSISGCSTSSKSSGTQTSPDGESVRWVPIEQIDHSQASSIDIHYSLDRENFRFFASDSRAEPQSIAQAYMDKRLLKEGKITRERYLGFLKKAADLVKSCHKLEKTDGGCRNPFKIKIQLDQQFYSAAGCRSTDGGALSRLINEGEFLLYSKN